MVGSSIYGLQRGGRRSRDWARRIAFSFAAAYAVMSGAATPIYPITDIGTRRGTYTYVLGLNESGQVAGYSYLGGDVTFHAFLWKNDGTPMVDLGSRT
jgi:probable HAF family extracellular repeat protein